ncbi:MAG: DUF2993 domain-containing protein [Cyanobacteria bacterium P01_C01_bin.120]
MASSSSPSNGNGIISRVLPPAIRFWLSTQLEQVNNLQFQIKGRDRELLSGHIPEVSLSAQKAIYQGIHLSHAAATAHTIRINLKQILRRQPLRLLAPFPISGDVELTEADFNASLQSPLLGEGLYDFFRLMANSQPAAAPIKHMLNNLPERNLLAQYCPSAELIADQICLRLQPIESQALAAIAISTQLSIHNGHCLRLDHPRWLSETASDQATSATPLPELHGFEIDLGSQVTLTKCLIVHKKLQLSGTIRVLPGE